MQRETRMTSPDRRFDFFKHLAWLNLAALLVLCLMGREGDFQVSKALVFRLGFMPLVLSLAASLIMMVVTMRPGDRSAPVPPQEVDIRGYITFLFSVFTPTLFLLGAVWVAIAAGVAYW